jgi:hypothetical protein
MLNALLLLLAMSAVADAPKIDRIFPLGAQRGETTEVTLAGKPGGSLEGWSDRKGLSFQFDAKSKKVAVTVAKDALPGRCFVRFYNDAGATKLFPFVVGTLAEVNEVEPNDRRNASQKCAGNVTVNGVLSKAGDVDVYAVALKRGQTFVASMNAHRLGSPMDGVLQLLHAQGHVLTQNDEGHGFDPQIVFQVPADGDYLVQTFAFPSAPNSSIRFAGAATYAYRLMMTTGPVIDHAMPLVAESGKTDTVSLHGWNVSDGARAKLTATAEPELLTTVVDAGNPPVVPVVKHASLVEGDAGAVQSLPFSLSGTVSEAGEVDAVRIKAAKGSLLVNVVAQSVHSLLDPVVVVRSADGKVVKELDDISRSDRDIKATVKLPTDGEYTVELRDRFGHGGARYVYALSCEKPIADFSVSAAANAFVLTKTKGKANALEIPLRVERVHGFAEAISISVEGLPEHVTAAVVKSEPKGGSSKAVKLVLKSSADKPFSGPVRIRCRSASKRERFATAATGLGKVRTSYFWLSLMR